MTCGKSTLNSCGGIRTLRHEAHVAERAGIGDLVVIAHRDRIEFSSCGAVDQIEQPRERIAQIEAPPAGVTDVPDPAHLRFGLRPIGELRIVPRDRASGGCFQAAFSHWSSTKKGREALASTPFCTGDES